MVIDDFGDVYGAYLMLTGPEYSWRDLYDVADDIKRELVLVDGVRKVVIDGEQREVVYLDMSRARLADLGIDPALIAGLLGSQNSVVDAGQCAASVTTICAFSPPGELRVRAGNRRCSDEL
jgi:multidrug efflux pump subunit AcrB